MAKLATIKFKWTRSVTPVEYISKIELMTRINGQESVYEVDKALESFNVEIKAKAQVAFKVTVYGDTEDDVASTSEVTFNLPDFETVQPVTGLAWEVVSVRDEEPTPPPAPTPEPVIPEV